MFVSCFLCLFNNKQEIGKYPVSPEESCKLSVEKMLLPKA